jgi:hypothetical protein
MGEEEGSTVEKEGELGSAKITDSLITRSQLTPLGTFLAPQVLEIRLS